MPKDPQSAAIRSALYRAMIVAAIGVVMVIGEKYRILGFVNLGAAVLVFVFQYLLPLQRIRAARSSAPD